MHRLIGLEDATDMIPMILVNFLVRETPFHYREHWFVRCKIKYLYTQDQTGWS